MKKLDLGQKESSSKAVSPAAWRDPDGLGCLTIAVVGLARTGRAVAAILRRRGARVLAYDQQDYSSDPEIGVLKRAGVSAIFGTEYLRIEEADLIVPSPGIRRDSRVLLEADRRGVPILSEIEVAYRISHAPIIAFTGTNGKSTTTALCGEMLRSAGIAVAIGGNLAPGTPLAPLAETASENSVLVAEISSFQLEWIDQFRPRVAGILNLSAEHLDRHGSLHEYAAAKSRICENQSGADLAIFGDAFAEAYPDLLIGAARHYRFCSSHPVESGAYLDKDRIRIVGRVDPAEASLPDLSLDLSRFTLAGRFNRENAMAAALAALEMGARPEAIERALRTFKGLPHRMELAAEQNGIRYVNNSMCTNPAAAAASLEAISGGLVVIAGGRSKGLDMRPFGETLARRAHWTVLIGETADEMAGYFREAGSTSFELAPAMPEAVDAAARRAEPGDTVLLLPGFSSFDMFRDFEERGRAFVEAARSQTRDGVGHE